MFYLTKPTDTQTVTALDQNGRPFLGDISGVSVSSDQPDVVGVGSLTFTNGVATLSLAQGTPGVANITIVGGGISQVEQVESYEPALTSFQIGTAS